MTTEDSRSAPPAPRNSKELGETREDFVVDSEQVDDKDGANSPNTSTRSTILYGQEPSDTFNDKVAHICSSEFRNTTFNIEHIEGGSYNRITAVTIFPRLPAKWTLPWLRSFLPRITGRLEPQVPKNYILRTPRWDQSRNNWDISYDIPALEFARKHLGSVVPRIVRLDTSPDNILSRPYTIQDYLPGRNLERIWKTLTMAQKDCALRIIVDFTMKLQIITSSSAGIIAPSNDIEHMASEEELQLHTFKVGHNRVPTWTKPWSTHAVPQTTLEFLVEQASRWQEFEGHNDQFVNPEWAHFKRIAQSLHDKGFIPDTDKFYFCHLDLYSRNMLVEIVDESTLLLTGVLDWDAEFAHFCPKFVAYRAPFWLWLEDDSNEWDEIGGNYEIRALSTPADADQLELKKTFEELADEEWLRYAFEPEFIIARRVFELLRNGVHGPEHWQEARDIFQTWQQMYPETEGLVEDDLPICGSDCSSELDEDDCCESSNDGEYSEDENDDAGPKVLS
ncbi:uncharacterized protein K460DRAFT_289852 [Cucurbitaria berberidis CBS 394.84]|uniref:Aminoglycoside phosphotransferase domain-containing protein n=1 Tax=Cucurbitaria berberidis CBS 394.84 TaxID=1168544 RepID=A0A9P4GCP2_9PLEO|nr:uncharacterized protein K460DRAFT_289852 [Cucurbitaria berberidis CBS 394.84]KAF1842770.1 hypothetical protein K460DRAFT_289852 [Cucurbitaria berberidis CBS 394.84]